MRAIDIIKNMVELGSTEQMGILETGEEEMSDLFTHFFGEDFKPITSVLPKANTSYIYSFNCRLNAKEMASNVIVLMNGSRELIYIYEIE
jgi:hypothetical protein